jgi:hypothetical protein
METAGEEASADIRRESKPGLSGVVKVGGKRNG